VEIGGRTFDALSEGVVIEAGQQVRVVELRGTRLVVRPIDDSEMAAAGPDPDDPLSQPIDQLGFDPFEDPLV
jgi:hypothetical protein